MRHRSSSTISRYSGSLDQTLCNNTHNVSTRQGPYLGVSHECDDVVTPKYKERQNSGEIINNPFYHLIRTYEFGGNHTHAMSYKTTCSGTIVKQETGDYQFTAVEGVQANTPVWTLDEQYYVNSALADAFAGVSLKNVDSLVILGELHKTISQLRNPLASARKFVDKMNVETYKKVKVRGNRKVINPYDLKRTKYVAAGKTRTTYIQQIESQNKAIDHASALSDTWIELQFGLIPLLRDIDSILGELKFQFDKRTTSRAFASHSTTSTETRKRQGSLLNYDFDVETVTTESIEVRAGVLYSQLASLSSNWGLTISDIPAAAWELTPWSFVVDYFSNLQQFIEGLTPKAGTEVRAAWTMCKKEQVITRTYKNYKLGPNLSGSYNLTSTPNGWDKVTFVEKQRLPRSRLDLRPVWNSMPTDHQIINLVALITSQAARLLK